MSQSLSDWLSRGFTDLVHAVADTVALHVSGLRANGTHFYGYAILPGERGNIRSIVAAVNCESDITVLPTDKMHRYYRYSVDEWKHYFHDRFDTVNNLLRELNAQFANLHPPDPDRYSFDDDELRYANVLLHSIIDGLNLAKSRKAFGPVAPFLAVWISDSDGGIIRESVTALNEKQVVKDFLIEFGK